MCILSQYNLKIIVYVYKKKNLIQAFEIFERLTGKKGVGFWVGGQAKMLLLKPLNCHT